MEIRVRMDKLKIEVRFEHLSVLGEAHVGSRALLTLLNSIMNAVEDLRKIFFLMGNEFGHPEENMFMTSEHQYISHKDKGDQVIVFERGDLVLVFNFHWTNSYSDYRIGCSKPGKYKVVLDSESELFGGFGRIHHAAEFFTHEGYYDDRPRSFMVYAPSRTAVVYGPAEDDVSRPVAE
ncbi:hypothetical protein DM860_016213 [Cuscuta australis]|uniref:Alpha-amylase/branching enzyme C-terminal all beta domain-containing protein n=1 Tax=Cuscuta australis TaxID=267555 RepID=A0A328DQT2_9ASTE|nr:hypothetical protein DM860_016213 [Cuscuta australis]